MSSPSPQVVRTLIANHDPQLLELMDALKAKFQAKLVTLEIPEARVALGNVRELGQEAVERIPRWTGRIQTHAEVQAEWKAAKRAKPARRGTIKPAPSRRHTA